MSDTLAGFTAYTTTKGLPAFKQRFQTADGKVHETRIEAPGGVGLELIGGRAYIVAREATVYFQPEGLAGISLPKADSAQAAGLAANYGIGPEFLERGRSRETSIETNDPSLAKVGLGLGPSPAFGATGGIDFGPIVAIAVVLAAIGVLALALSTRRKQES